MAIIELRRQNGFIDALRSWSVVIDGENKGKIARNAVKQFPVNAGVHTVQLKIAWCGSNLVEVDTSNQDVIFMECRPRRRIVLATLFWPASAIEMIISPDQRIVLEQISP